VLLELCKRFDLKLRRLRCVECAGASLGPHPVSCITRQRPSYGFLRPFRTVPGFSRIAHGFREGARCDKLETGAKVANLATGLAKQEKKA
jgi:hypothetical protein